MPKLSEYKNKDHIKLVVAQIELTIGDLQKNKQKILDSINKAKNELKADLILFPELCVTGYPPEDLLLRDDFHVVVSKTVQEIIAEVKNIDVILTYPYKNLDNNKLYNTAALVRNGKIIKKYYKQLLPNYSVFDEKRYFTQGDESYCIFELNNIKIAINICEDIWYPEGPVMQAKKAGAELILSTNASPFCLDKAEIRKQVIKDRALEVALPIVYAHNVGAHDELVFDGGSMVVNADGNIAVQGGFFTEELILMECYKDSNKIFFKQEALPKPCIEEELIYKAIIQGVKTYVHNSGFKGALVGLSGGIDSAVVLALAVAALGKDNVEAVMMPSKYNSNISLEDAIAECEKLGVKYHIIKIDELFDNFNKVLNPIFANLLANISNNTAIDVTEQNLQARIRGVILMALSNKLGKIVLATGNKSEMAVGYATLYGDMCGGYSPIKDLFKGMVYRLANYINSISDNFIIPKRVITRAPSAELAPDQTDQDNLPPYDVLDGILKRYIVLDMGLEQIANDGFEKNIVAEVITMVDKNEYKRRQAAPGVRISAKAFGRDRRVPIVSGYKY